MRHADTPIAPGDVLREEIVAMAGLTQDALAEALGVSRYSVNQLLNNRRSVTADMALRLARVLDTTPEFWLNLQMAVDLAEARQKLGSALGMLPVIKPRKSIERRFKPLAELIDGE